MQPTLCSRCGKNVAVIFITRMDGGQTRNEGLCLKCARELHIKPVDDLINKMGLTDDELDNLTGEMMEALGNAEGLMDIENTDSDADDDGKTATFPFLNRLMGQMGNTPQRQDNSNLPAQSGPGQERQSGPQAQTAPPQRGKRKFLDNYCIDLTQRAREGKLDAMIGREEELERVIQILNRRQKNNPCLIGEPGVGKTAIA
ncbi:MAG TPA: ATP-dependent Clp protease ATP-binding subunit, partial [Candidatus Scatomorpha merdigallinarum]|nr:ATP-dependent Clp protease ATP-binding subunit [Candidatus Scatomorpha merdigallinarum]